MALSKLLNLLKSNEFVVSPGLLDCCSAKQVLLSFLKLGVFMGEAYQVLETTCTSLALHVFYRSLTSSCRTSGAIIGWFTCPLSKLISWENTPYCSLDTRSMDTNWPILDSLHVFSW